MTDRILQKAARGALADAQMLEGLVDAWLCLDSSKRLIGAIERVVQRRYARVLSLFINWVYSSD